MRDYAIYAQAATHSRYTRRKRCVPKGTEALVGILFTEREEGRSVVTKMQ